MVAAPQPEDAPAGVGSTPGIILVGCGNMGGALLAGWLDRGIPPASVHVVEPAIGHLGRLPAGVGSSADAAAAPAVADAVVLAVKPQLLADVAPAYADRARGGSLILSIAAGRTLASLAGWLGAGTAIVRAMPNTPAAIGRGISVAVASAGVDPGQRRLADELLAAAGEVAWVDDEALIDAVTAVSGSGPAYVFLLAECLTDAGIEVGLSPALAARLARATVAGAGELLHRAEEPAAELRRRVTSPGGTTEAALAVLMAADGLAPLFIRAVAAAAARARTLAG
ncbi:MAG: pyrroline-5-carboxylate reductase [Rhodospirillales bacterium]